MPNVTAYKQQVLGASFYLDLSSLSTLGRTTRIVIRLLPHFDGHQTHSTEQRKWYSYPAISTTESEAAHVNQCLAILRLRLIGAHDEGFITSPSHSSSHPLSQSWGRGTVDARELSGQLMGDADSWHSTSLPPFHFSGRKDWGKHSSLPRTNRTATVAAARV